MNPLTEFKCLFGGRSQPYIRVKGEPIPYRRFPGKWGVWDVSDFYIDYVRNVLQWTKYWLAPDYDVKQFLGSNTVTWNSKAKKSEVSRTLGTIESQRLQLQTILICAEKQIKYFILYRHHLRQEGQGDRNREHIASIIDMKRRHLKHYHTLREYYLLLEKYADRYQKLQEGLQKRDRCFECLDEYCAITQVKGRMICEDCRQKQTAAQQSSECPICLSTHKMGKMVEITCGNGHHVCRRCYQTLIEYETTNCPICRAKF
jgi:hypothetical protein